MSRVKRTERGWVGHFICGYRCLFRRNTLLELDEKAIIVSTIGNMLKDMKDPSKGVDEVGLDRYFETMAFEARENGAYIDIDVDNPVEFESKWCIGKEEWLQDGVDNRANEMHETVVSEITEKLENGRMFEEEQVAELTLKEIESMHNLGESTKSLIKEQLFEEKEE